jgi:hypothetical protein
MIGAIKRIIFRKKPRPIEASYKGSFYVGNRPHVDALRIWIDGEKYNDISVAGLSLGEKVITLLYDGPSGTKKVATIVASIEWACEVERTVLAMMKPDNEYAKWRREKKLREFLQTKV